MSIFSNFSWRLCFKAYKIYLRYRSTSFICTNLIDWLIWCWCQMSVFRIDMGRTRLKEINIVGNIYPWNNQKDGWFDSYKKGLYWIKSTILTWNRPIRTTHVTYKERKHLNTRDTRIHLILSIRRSCVFHSSHLISEWPHVSGCSLIKFARMKRVHVLVTQNWIIRCWWNSEIQ